MELPNTMLALSDHYSEQFRESFATLVESRLEGNPEELSAEMISSVTTALSQASQQAARSALENLIQNLEPTPGKTLEHKEIRYQFNKRARKSFLTQFGRIELERDLYYPAGKSGKQKAYCPLDEAWEMSGRFATAEVVEPILMASASMDPKEIKALLDKLGSFSLSAEAIYDIRCDEGASLHDWVQTQDGLQARLQSLETPAQTTALVAGLDGANLPLRESAPKRGRPAERPTCADKDPDKPKQSCYKNAMVGSFSHYTSAEVIDIKTGQPRSDAVRLNSSYSAQMPQERFVDFKVEFEATLDHLEAQLPPGAKKMLLLDGGRPLWGYLDERAERFAEYDKVLDYYHAGEHLSLAAEAIFGKKSQEGTRWYQGWCAKLKAEEWAVDGLIRSMGYHGRKRKLSKSARKELEQQAGFFRRNRQWMNYAVYLKRGLPIGSGPTEAACKTIVKERMCRSGMRWSRSKGRSVLTLRAISKSKQWDQTWSGYREKCWNKAA